MIKHLFVLCTLRFLLASCYVLITALNENDLEIAFNAANFLARKGFNCELLIPKNFKDFMEHEDNVVVLLFESGFENSDLSEEVVSDPVPQIEVDSLLKGCEYLARDKKIIDTLISLPPSVAIFPSFLHDACMLPFISYLNSRSTNAKDITTLIWTSNYLSDYWVYYHLTSSIIPMTDIESGETGIYSRFKSFVNWWLFVREIKGSFVEPATGIIQSSLEDFETLIGNAPPYLSDWYESRVNLTLVGTHPLFTPTPLALGISPLTVNIACFHCRSAKPLPKEFEEHIMKYKAGAVIIESDLKSNIPEAVKQAIIYASKDLPFSVFWKRSSMNKKQFTGLPENLLVGTNLPLQDLLGHPKCRAFVSRCSMNSVLIATYHGMPIICLPATHFDKSVASFVEKHGIGVILPRNNITGKLLFNTISGVTNDHSFRSIARHLAETLRDQPETPGDRFIYAINHLERHRGHKHYSQLKKQSFISVHFWDVCIALTLVTVLFLLILSCGIWFLFCYFSGYATLINVDSKKIS